MENEKKGFSSFWGILGVIGGVLLVIYLLNTKGEKRLVELSKHNRPKAPKDVVVKKNAPKGKGISVRQSKILNLVMKRGGITSSQLIESIDGVTDRTLRRDLNVLIEKGRIVKKGSTKSSKYYSSI